MVLKLCKIKQFVKISYKCNLKFSINQLRGQFFAILIYVLIKFYPLIAVAHRIEVTHKVIEADSDGRGVVVGVETQCGILFEIHIQKQVSVVVGVVDKAEGRHRAGAQSEWVSIWSRLM